jgi:hypothetical protein
MICGTLIIETHSICISQITGTDRMCLHVANNFTGRTAVVEVSYAELGAVLALTFASDPFAADWEFSVEIENYLYAVAEPVMKRLAEQEMERNDFRMIP